MKKNNTCLTCGIVLSAVFAYLCFYFTMNGMWNVATVIVLLIIGALSAGQYVLHYKFFRTEKKVRYVKRKVKK